MKLWLAFLVSCLACLPAFGADGAAAARKVIVLGVDGMDPQLLARFRGEGLLPNMDRLAASGGIMPLGTSIPPQSPVAWSNFITGRDPGAHGIFDFVALDRKKMLPYLSTARVEPASRGPLEVGSWCIPLGSEKTVQLRDGEAFWEILEHHDIPTRLFRIPANYPPIASGQALSGMGTPDLRGTSGTFTFFTDDPAFTAGSVSGGQIERVAVNGHRIEASIQGPPNGLRCAGEVARAPFSVDVDPEHPVVGIRMGERRVVLRAGEWSEWTPVDFELAPIVTVPGMVRFYLKEVRPHFRLYVSPVNIDPGNPAQTISTPTSWLGTQEYARELFEAAGPFYTQEMPEDTKALTHHVLTPSEFLAQSGLVLDERRRLLAHELHRFHEDQQRGLLFFYLSSIDQRSHMLWRQMDAGHPFHDGQAPEAVARALRDGYVEIDEIVGGVMETVDEETTLIVMSDHGFRPFRYQAHLNRWLEEKGYLALRPDADREQSEWLRGIDWSRTRAFALGLNSLYLSVRGRERYGVVSQREREALAREIAKALEGWIDPATGQPVVTRASVREDVYHGPHVDEAPDILVGYGPGYRASWDTTTGKVPDHLIEANDREWSGDHCVDARLVPGVLLANRPLRAAEADLRDLTATLLETFGVAVPETMQGENVF